MSENKYKQTDYKSLTSLNIADTLKSISAHNLSDMLKKDDTRPEIAKNVEHTMQIIRD